VTSRRAPTDTAPAGTYAVGRAERTFVDRSRTTAAHGGQPEQDSRTLKALVLYPAESPGDRARAISGRWPLIVFSHGSTREGIDYEATLSWWVSAGYVVVAPDFPLSKTGTPGGTRYTDFEAQAGDVSFVIDQVIADTDPGLPLGQLVDPENIGAGGQSFGAITTLTAMAAICCADERIDAATEFAGMWLPTSTGTDVDHRARNRPILFVHGDRDPTVPYAQGRKAWETIRAPGGFLTLVGSGHDDGYFGGGSTALDRLVSDATLAFYDRWLKGDPSGTARLHSSIDSAGPDVAKLEESSP